MTAPDFPAGSPVNTLLARLEAVKQAGGGWIARCPAHADTRPSLKIDTGDDGRALLHCYAGCEPASIVAAIGLTMADTFARDSPPVRPPASYATSEQITYDYRDASGAVVFQEVRDPPKRFWMRCPDGRGGWSKGLDGVARVLWNLPELIARRDEPVFLTEGAKDAERLRSLGLLATTTANGAAARWLDGYSETLKGRDVAILADNDPAGITCAQKRAQALQGIASRVRIVLLPDLPAKGDVSDWLDAGHTRAELIQIVKDTPESAAGADEQGANEPGPGSTRFHPLSIAELEALQLPEREDVVDGGLLVAGSVTLFSAREKSGKTMLCTDLACSIVAEQPFLDRAVASGPVIFIALEENIREVRRRILDRLGTQRDVPLWVLPANGFTDDVFRLDHPASMAMFAAMTREYGASVVFVDTMREAHRMRENEGDDMGPLMRPLRQIAHDSNCAVVLLHHQNKMGGSRGSTAIAAGVDQLWSFQRTDTEQDGDTPPVGKLTVEGRFGPRQVIGIRLGDGLRWQVDHSLELVDQTLRGRVLATLGRHVPGMTAPEIASALDIKLKTIQNEMSRILQETPAPIATIGAGTKGNPRRYVSVTPALFPDDSRNDGNDDIQMVPKFPRVGVGNDGNDFEALDLTGTDDDWEVF